jgi:TM2 domain-containing membrane protein YozV
MDRKSAAFVLGALSLALLPVAAQAYIGPGVGAGALGAVVGVIGAVFLAIFAVLWYPIKRMMKGKKKPVQADKTATK